MTGEKEGRLVVRVCANGDRETEVEHVAMMIV